MKAEAIPCAVLMCHAPIVIPGIAGPENRETIAKSTKAMSQAAQRALGARPDVLVVLSPHAARDPETFTVFEQPVLRGSFARFGHPEIAAEFPNAPSAREALLQAARELGVDLFPRRGRELDHGALVPLYFFGEAGWSGRTLLVSFPFEPSFEENRRLGEAIARAAEASGERWVVLASGDMSHCLIPGAPAGYHPRAREFDSWISDHVSRGELTQACEVDPELRELAAEDVVNSLAVASGAVGAVSGSAEVLSYEGPFGVGYLNAILAE